MFNVLRDHVSNIHLSIVFSAQYCGSKEL